MTLRLGDHVTDEAGLAAAPEDTVLLELPTPAYPHPLVYVKRNDLWFTDAIWFPIDPEVILAGGSDLIVVHLPGEAPRPERVVEAEALRAAADRCARRADDNGSAPAAGAFRSFSRILHFEADEIERGDS